MIYLVALILGIALPVVVIYIIELLKYKIEAAPMWKKSPPFPLWAMYPCRKIKGKERKHCSTRKTKNDLMAKPSVMYALNVLLYDEERREKSYWVTSTTTGEGKTFIASNLAVSLALLGKKIVIVGLDIRKPSLNKAFNLSHREQGISQFLRQSGTYRPDVAGTSFTHQCQLVHSARRPIPPNPTELVARESLPQAIDILKKHFDYIILDTAPIGMVTDTLLISRVANASIYVCRADYTHKADYTLINELSEQKKLPTYVPLSTDWT